MSTDKLTVKATLDWPPEFAPEVAALPPPRLTIAPSRSDCFVAEWDYPTDLDWSGADFGAMPVGTSTESGQVGRGS